MHRLTRESADMDMALNDISKKSIKSDLIDYLKISSERVMYKVTE